MRAVLVRLPNWLGDMLMARPLLASLRSAGGGVTAMGAPALTDLLAAEGLWDEVLPARATASAHSMAIVCPPSFSSAWQAWRSGSTRRIGFGGEWRDLLLTDRVARGERGSRHLADEYLDLAAAAGVPPAPWTDLTVPAGDPPRWERPYAVLGPGAIYGPAKRWPVSRWVDLGRRIVTRKHTVLVCGSAAEQELCRRVADGIGSGAHALAGRTDLLAQARICAAAAVAVCNDSGLAHLAAAVGCATVVIFGSTSSSWTAPLGRRVRVVQQAPVCSPCFQRTCSIGYACLDAVSVERVWHHLSSMGAVA